MIIEQFGFQFEHLPAPHIPGTGMKDYREGRQVTMTIFRG